MDGANRIGHGVSAYPKGIYIGSEVIAPDNVWNLGCHMYMQQSVSTQHNGFTLSPTRRDCWNIATYIAWRIRPSEFHAVGDVPQSASSFDIIKAASKKGHA